MTDIQLRPARRQDAAVVYGLLKRLARSLGKEKDFNGSVKAIETYGFDTNPAFEVIIAWQGQTPVGFVLFFFEFSSWRGLPGVYLQDLFVASAVRGQGLGQRLVHSAVERGKQQQANYLRLCVHAGNDAGLKFYREMGFRVVSDESILMLDGKAFSPPTKEEI